MSGRTRKPYQRGALIETFKRLAPEMDWSDEALEKTRQRRLNAGPEAYIPRERLISQGQVTITLGVERPKAGQTNGKKS